LGNDQQPRTDKGLLAQVAGFVTGEINGLFVVETDTAAHGKDGDAELKKLIAANGGEWFSTLTARSPSGSNHYYFTWPEGDNIVIHNSDNKLAPGVDIRGDGGMVVAPPSINPKYGLDARYQWISPQGQGIVNAPDWLVQLIAEQPIERKVSTPEAPIDKLAAAMDLIPNTDASVTWDITDRETGEVKTRTGWEGWNVIMMALHRATDGSDQGFAIADKWCRENKDKYNARYTRYSWYRRYVRSPPKELGAGILFKLADEYQPGWLAIWNEEAPGRS